MSHNSRARMNNTRDITLPEIIKVHIGNELIEVSRKDMPFHEYLKLCISMDLYYENGII